MCVFSKFVFNSLMPPYSLISKTLLGFEPWTQRYQGVQSNALTIALS